MPVYSMTGYASATSGAQTATEPTGATEDTRSWQARCVDSSSRQRHASNCARSAVVSWTSLSRHAGRIPLSRTGTARAADQQLPPRQDRAAPEHQGRVRQRLAPASARTDEPAGAPGKHHPGLAAQGATPVGARSDAVVQGRRAPARAARRGGARRRQALHRRPARGARTRRRKAGGGADGARQTPARTGRCRPSRLVPAAVVKRQQQRFPA